VILISRSIAFLAIGASGILISLYLLFPLNDIRVEGNEMLPASALLEDIPDRTSLPMIRAGNLERGLNSNSWVKGVDVNKDWDSGTVVVEVEERAAALNASLTGGERVVLAEDGTRLPGLGGASLSEIEVGRVRLKQIQEGQKVLERNGVEVESVESVGGEGVELSVKGSGGSGGSGSKVMFSGGIGGGQARMLEELLSERSEARYFDLRTPGRVVVGPAPEQNASTTETARGFG
jgi:cell division protein FtsQ